MPANKWNTPKQQDIYTEKTVVDLACVMAIGLLLVPVTVFILDILYSFMAY